MIVSMFFAFGGYFGQFDKSEFSIDDLVLEFAEQLDAGNSTFHLQNVKMWHKILTHGIAPKEFLHELGLDSVSEDFIQRGILTDSEDTSSKKVSSEKKKK